MKFLKLMLLAGATGSASAAEFSVEIQNLTQGIYFTPFLVAAHNTELDVYEPGQAASNEVIAIAEGGNIEPLQTVLQTAGATIVANPADGLLAPGATASIASINTDGTENTALSIISMLLPTNDGFVGLDSWSIPENPGTYTIYLNAYDAGSEANDERLNPGAGGTPGEFGIPAAPGEGAGSNGTGVTDVENNTYIHIHRGVIGDEDPNGGKSDLNATIHRWLNPVVKVTITVS